MLISKHFIMCAVYFSYLCMSEGEVGAEDPDQTTLTTLLRTEQTQESKFLVPDDKWFVNALQDIAYYLRNHKFNEWDRRYYKQKPKDDLTGFYTAFPNPSLRSIQWKVFDNCSKDFYKCITYLYSVIESAPFTRSDDITTLLNRKSVKNKTLINKMDNNCKKALLYAEKTGLPFDTPKERFQWRVSASYYMCWYTLLGIPALSMLGESCDNFANCLDSQFGNRNHDPRSNDKFSFACAMYSFCPDPCCPLKHIKTSSQCHNNFHNPCYTENPKSTRLSRRECTINRKYNQNFEKIIENEWNVSCYCKEKGFEWKSQFGICVDVNECTSNMHNCKHESENCLNLPGTFQCICKWGYAYDVITKKCTKKNITLNFNQSDNYKGFVDNVKCFLDYIGF